MNDLLTSGFRTQKHLQTHFLKHKDDYGVNTMEEYLALADQFLGCELKGHMKKCHCTTNDDILRYDKRSQDYGMLWQGYIVTFYKLSKGSNQRNEEYFDKCCNDCQGTDQ